MSMKRMEDKVVIVTGASEGIGRATALMLARHGAHVALCSRNVDRLQSLQAEIEAQGGTAEFAQVDITDVDRLDAHIMDVAARHRRLDGLVNNAFIATYGAVVDASNDQWRTAFAGGADAAFVATRAALRVMIPQRRGSVVNIASVNGLQAMPNMSTYSASKAAIIQFSSVAAAEAAPAGVRVNSIAPGMIATQAAINFFKDNPDLRERVESCIPMLRSGEPDEIAYPIMFLLSDESSFVTGTCLTVDGGKASQLFYTSA